MEKPDEIDVGAGFGPEIDTFLHRIESLAFTVPLVMDLFDSNRDTSARRVTEFLNLKAESIRVTGTVKQYAIGSQFISELRMLTKEMRNNHTAATSTRRSFVVTLVTEFATFLGAIIRKMFFVRPELLRASGQSIPLADLMEIGSIQGAQEYLIEREVETVLRLSHFDQFQWLEKKVNLQLCNDLACWPRFIEITERRNIFVHADGIVSSQYINSCAKHGVALSRDLAAGKKVGVSRGYFSDAYNTVFEMGVKLAQIIWRKLCPKDLDKCDTSLSNICFDLLSSEQYVLAKGLLEFATHGLPKVSSERDRLVFVVNSAIAAKGHDSLEAANKILDKVEWSVCAAEFRVAVAGVRNDFVEAARLMKSIGSNGDVSKESYTEWPAFREFRNTELFSKTFDEVFGEQLEVITEDSEILDGVYELTEGEGGPPKVDEGSGEAAE